MAMKCLVSAPSQGSFSCRKYLPFECRLALNYSKEEIFQYLERAKHIISLIVSSRTSPLCAFTRLHRYNILRTGRGGIPGILLAKENPCMLSDNCSSRFTCWWFWLSYTAAQFFVWVDAWWDVRLDGKCCSTWLKQEVESVVEMEKRNESSDLLISEPSLPAHDHESPHVLWLTTSKRCKFWMFE